MYGIDRLMFQRKKKGYSFLYRNDTSPDIFVHETAIPRHNMQETARQWNLTSLKERRVWKPPT